MNIESYLLSYFYTSGGLYPRGHFTPNFDKEFVYFEREISLKINQL